MNETPKHLPADERRAATVEAVIDLAAEQNPSDITTAAIAQRMGLTQGALFRHFPNKDAILQAVMAWVAERLLARVDEAMLGAASGVAALEAIFMAHIDFVAQHPGVPRIIFGELQRAEDSPAKRAVREFMGQYVGKLQAFIEQGKAGGEIGPDVNAKAAATLFVGMIQGLVVQSLVSGSKGIPQAKAHEIFALYRRSIRTAT